MDSEIKNRLSWYKEVADLCPKGHIKLVQNEWNEQLYVKKCLHCYNFAVYRQLQEHPIQNIPAIIELFETEDELIVIEEYLPGSTLAELLTQKPAFSEKETLDIAIQLCKILTKLHTLTPPIIHRDIKPSNVLLTPDGIVKLLDFNAAKPENTVKNQDTTLIGTAGYAAPEQYGFAPSSPQTDIYALGVLMNICLTGRLPIEEPASGKLQSLIRRCLELNPKDRYSSVKELHRALVRLQTANREWLPPGFRTMRVPKMLIAVIGYLIILYSSFQMTIDNYKNLVELYLYRFVFFFIAILLVFFYCNYLNFRRLFPFMKSSRKGLRILGMILAPVIIFWTVIVLTAIFEIIFL